MISFNPQALLAKGGKTPSPLAGGLFFAKGWP